MSEYDFLPKEPGKFSQQEALETIAGVAHSMGDQVLLWRYTHGSNVSKLTMDQIAALVRKGWNILIESRGDYVQGWKRFETEETGLLEFESCTGRVRYECNCDCCGPVSSFVWLTKGE